MAGERIFGAIPGIDVGAEFASRKELGAAGIHRPPMAGIAGSGREGSESIVLNGGYADDKDYGDLVIYTGEGGQEGGRQVRDQTMTKGNLGLVLSLDNELPVRVTRGWKGGSEWSPKSGFRYDGLYQVVRHWPQTGIDGFLVWMFRLERIDQSGSIVGGPTGPAPRSPFQGDRMDRNAKLAETVKEIHDFTCQVCGERLESPTRPYAEAAHIKPLGSPDDGPDIKANLLCLCPNHHKLLDNGGLMVDQDLSFIHSLSGKTIGKLAQIPRHKVGLEFLNWHRERWIKANQTKP